MRDKLSKSPLLFFLVAISVKDLSYLVGTKFTSGNSTGDIMTNDQWERE